MRGLGGLGTAVAVLAALATASGCDAGTSDTQDAPDPTVAATPDLPRADGPIAVRLQPALPSVSDGECAPAAGEGRICGPDGQSAYRVLGTPRSVTVTAALTRPTPDHGSWDAIVRVDRSDHAAVEAAGDQAAGFGGVVLVLPDRVAGSAAPEVLEVVPPPALTSGNARLLGLEKPEAWAFVEALQTLQNGV